MYNLNSVLIEGAVASAPALKESKTDGRTVVGFTVYNRKWSGKKGEASTPYLFEVEVWNKLGDVCLKNLRKGSGVRITGWLKNDLWALKQGLSQTGIVIVGEQVDLKVQFECNPAQIPEEVE